MEKSSVREQVEERIVFTLVAPEVDEPSPRKERQPVLLGSVHCHEKLPANVLVIQIRKDTAAHTRSILLPTPWVSGQTWQLQLLKECVQPKDDPHIVLTNLG
jgi:hypothetical protein